MISFTTLFWRLLLLTTITGFCGKDPITFFVHMPEDFMDGFNDHPAELRYRPGWQNWGQF